MLLKALSILSFSFEKQLPEIRYREHLALLLMQSDMKLQTHVATLLVKYFNTDVDINGLAEVILPYQDYFNTKTQTVFEPILAKTSASPSVKDEAIDEALLVEKPLNIDDLTPIHIPQTWHDVLFLIGDVVNFNTVAGIDIFFDSLVRLQDLIPTDFAKQIKPYMKKLSSFAWSGTNLRLLHDFVFEWVNGKAYDEHRAHEFTVSQYLTEKAQLTQQKLKDHDTFGFLATPTHEPFYIEPTIFLERLLAYQIANKEPAIYDMIVACNRLVHQSITPTHQQTAKQLTGKYSQAIQYYFGLTDSITPCEATLPLWTQIARINNPHGTFQQFDKTSAKEIPTVIEPFKLNYVIEKTRHFYRLTALSSTKHKPFKWNQHWGEETLWFDEKYYHAGSLKRENDAEIAYQLSLSPHYVEAQVCRYISDFDDNEVYEANGQLIPLKYLIAYELPIYHGGWLYVAISLVYGRRPIREVAYQYILLAIRKGWQLDDLAVIVADLLAGHFAPLGRFLEYADKFDDNLQVTQFKFAVLNHCVDKIDPTKPPRGYKKLLAYQQEFANRLAG